MIFRPLQESDLPQIQEIELASFSDAWREADFFSYLRFPVLQAIVAEEGGQVCGYACIQVVCEEMELQNIAVSPLLRGKGLGSKLLAEAERCAKEKGAEISFLEVRVSNAPAISLYQKFAYQTVAVRKRYYPDGEDALVMKKEL